MSQQLISRSPDLKQLRDEGYELETSGGYLFIHQVPYVTSSKQISKGTLICNLDLINNNRTSRPKSHVMYFTGEEPCDQNGGAIRNIIHSQRKQIFNGHESKYLFSSKPPVGYYDDYYQKVTTYVKILSNPAKAIDPNVSEKTFKVIQTTEADSVFRYYDTNSSRANIENINLKLKGQRIAIIGLGGTGAYILDFVAKTPVGEIHLFDGDYFLLHNAFRSPETPTNDDLESKKLKTDYYFNIYSRMHKYIFPHSVYINRYNISELVNMSFVFLAIDKDSVKKEIIEYLLLKGIPFIDVGLGVNIVDDSIIGTIRTTMGTINKNDHLFERISCGEDLVNEYNTNIQIVELNALNACQAVIKWKKLFGFYQDLRQEHNSSYSLNVSQLQNIMT